ncbi:uncharacterized protein L969DRAFT_263888 [Mixia osmundae IAM 14324]|uniref:uncharacterized protein n=1 Tax=Mixia osmundae (strain CBS 9802 / IAM 14324 / JCM 22182 / KY 12970) TaxID=764103 RepID=UPI0004A55546|nr:uncharacterized protein L969DRAFT_263888 [Mixia osmundae IAM 14324]KEI36586.1 hypothetical protein L969DRAFT_263888 [Mixia osmundae IAM 14324]
MPQCIYIVSLFDLARLVRSCSHALLSNYILSSRGRRAGRLWTGRCRLLIAQSAPKSYANIKEHLSVGCCLSQGSEPRKCSNIPDSTLFWHLLSSFVLNSIFPGQFPADFVCEWVEHQPLPATALSVVT